MAQRCFRIMTMVVAGACVGVTPGAWAAPVTPSAVQEPLVTSEPDTPRPPLRLLSSVVVLGAPAAAGVVAAGTLWAAAGATWTLGGTRLRMENQSPFMLPMRTGWLLLLWSGAAAGVVLMAGVAASAGVMGVWLLRE